MAALSGGGRRSSPLWVKDKGSWELPLHIGLRARIWVYTHAPACGSQTLDPNSHLLKPVFPSVGEEHSPRQAHGRCSTAIALMGATMLISSMLSPEVRGRVQASALQNCFFIRIFMSWPETH